VVNVRIDRKKSDERVGPLSSARLTLLERSIVIDDDVNDPAGHRRSLSVVESSPWPIFRNPFTLLYQQRKNTSSTQSSKIGDSQGER